MKLLFSFVMAMIFTASSFADARSDAVARLQKGEYYYHYLTGNFPKAMNQLRNSIAQDEDVEASLDDDSETDIMHAAMLLSLGLDDDAEQQFVEVFGRQNLSAYILKLEQDLKLQEQLLAGDISPEDIAQLSDEELDQEAAEQTTVSSEEKPESQEGEQQVQTTAEQQTPQTEAEQVAESSVQESSEEITEETSEKTTEDAEQTQAESLASDSVSSSVNNEVKQASARAWFFLGKRWFELGQWLPAYKALYYAEQFKVSQDLWHEMRFMQITSLLELNETKKASKTMADMDKENMWTSYARHNFILAYLGGSSTGRSMGLFLEDTLFYVPKNEEGQSLKDRINLVAGVHFLEVGKSRKAIKHFQNISLDGDYTAPALLYYGWSLIELWQYEQALQPWRELQANYNPYAPEVIESLASVPYVLELLDVQTQALRTYEFTEKRLVDLLARLEKIQQGFEQNPWLNDWLNKQNPVIWGWSAEFSQVLEESDVSYALQELLVQDSFIAELESLRDVNNVTAQLEQQKNNLKLWRQMLQRRQQIYHQSKATQRLAALKDQLSAYQQGTQALNATYQSLAPGSDDLKTDQELRRDRRLQYFKPTLNQLLMTKFGRKSAQGYQERERRVVGVLKWQQYDDFAERKWQAEKSMTQLQRAIFAAQQQLSETEQANAWASKSWYGYQQQIDLAEKQVAAQLAVASQLKQQQYQQVQQLAAEYLAQMHTRIKTYLSQTKLAIARLYDDSLQAIKQVEQEQEYEEEEEQQDSEQSEESTDASGLQVADAADKSQEGN